MDEPFPVGTPVCVTIWSNQYPPRLIQEWTGERLTVTDPDCMGLGVVEVTHPITGEAWCFQSAHLARRS